MYIIQKSYLLLLNKNYNQKLLKTDINTDAHHCIDHIIMLTKRLFAVIITN